MGCIGSIPAADNFLVPEVTFQASGGGLMPGLGDDASLVLRYESWGPTSIAEAGCDLPAKTIEVKDSSGVVLFRVSARATGLQHFQEKSWIRNAEGAVIGCMATCQQQIPGAVDTTSYKLYGARPRVEGVQPEFSGEGVNMFPWALLTRRPASTTATIALAAPGGFEAAPTFRQSNRMGPPPQRFTLELASGGGCVHGDKQNGAMKLTLPKGMDPVLAVASNLMWKFALSEFPADSADSH